MAVSKHYLLACRTVLHARLICLKEPSFANSKRVPSTGKIVLHESHIPSPPHMEYFQIILFPYYIASASNDPIYPCGVIFRQLESHEFATYSQTKVPPSSHGIQNNALDPGNSISKFITVARRVYYNAFSLSLVNSLFRGCTAVARINLLSPSLLSPARESLIFRETRACPKKSKCSGSAKKEQTRSNSRIIRRQAERALGNRWPAKSARCFGSIYIHCTRQVRERA